MIPALQYQVILAKKVLMSNYHKKVLYRFDFAFSDLSGLFVLKFAQCYDSRTAECCDFLIKTILRRDQMPREYNKISKLVVIFWLKFKCKRAILKN